MKSIFDFPEIEGRLHWESEKYKPPQQHWYLAYTVLITAKNLRELHDFVHRHAGQQIDDGKMFQHFLVRQGANALESLYWLTKHHQYNAARDRSRYLYETYLTLRRLNSDQSAAAERWNETKAEAKELDSQRDLKPLERQPDALHSLRRSEKKRIEEAQGGDVYSDFYSLLSDRGAHPASIRGSWIDGRYSADNENSQFKIGLVFAFGLAAQYVRTFAGTPMRWPVQEQADQIIVDVKLAVSPRGLPTLFKDELYFWNPVNWKSPFLDD